MFKKLIRKNFLKRLRKVDTLGIKWYIEDYYHSQGVHMIIMLHFDYKLFFGWTMTIYSNYPGRLIGKYGCKIDEVKQYCKKKYGIKKVFIKDMNSGENVFIKIK